MLQGKCVDAGASTNLKVGEVYYLFPHGGLAYNVSRFPHSGSHFGTYQKSRFNLVEAAMEVPVQIPSKYLARVVKMPSHFYRIGEEYIITDSKANGYYSVFLTSRPNHGPVGSYRSNYFEIIEPYEVTEAAVTKDKSDTVHASQNVFEIGDIIEIIDESLIRRIHYENGKQATVIDNFYGCISIQLNEQPVDKKVIGSVLLVGDELQSIKKVISKPVLKEADMANDTPKMVQKKGRNGERICQKNKNMSS